MENIYTVGKAPFVEKTRMRIFIEVYALFAVSLFGKFNKNSYEDEIEFDFPIGWQICNFAIELMSGAFKGSDCVCVCFFWSIAKGIH